MGIESIQSRIAQIEAGFASLVPSAPAAAAPAGMFQAAMRQAAPPADDIAPSGVSVSGFSRDVLRAIGAPETTSNMQAMSAWVKSEGTKAGFNPLATCRAAPGASDFNSVGVKNFQSYEQGVQTTVGAIQNGLYQPVIEALRRGNDAYAVADAIKASPWGSGGLVRSVLHSRGVPEKSS